MSGFRDRLPAFPGSIAGRVGRYLAFDREFTQIRALDGLRGIAIILVLLRHAYRPFERPASPGLAAGGGDFLTFMSNGWIGVDLFFVLSGFLITHHIINLQARQNGLWLWAPYLTKRCLRIVPAYYAVLLLTAFALIPGYPVSDQYFGLRLGYHLLFLQDYLPANFVVAFWSLGVEEKFYLVAPFVVFAILRQTSVRRRLIGLLALLVTAPGMRVVTAVTTPGIDDYDAFFAALRSPFHMTLDPLVVGVMLAFIYRHRSELDFTRSRRLAHALFWAGTTLVLALSTTHSMMQSIGWWDKSLQPFALAAGFGAMTYGALFGGGPQALLQSFALFFCARISYCLYLIHMPLIPLALSLAERQPLPQFAGFVLTFIALSTAAALLLHYAVEKPFLILKDRTGRMRSRSRQEADAAVSV